METKFNEFKKEILKRAKEASACRAEYGRAYNSETFEELMQVIKDNFWFAVNGKVIDVALIEAYKEEFNTNMIWCNVNCSSGYLLADNATVEAWGNATVEAWGNATVEAWGNATVEAWGNATVEAWGNATVEAWGNATVEASDNATVKASGNATVKASDNATVKASDNATVEASDNAYVNSYCTIECKLSNNAVHRIRESNTIRYASDNIKFERV